MGAATRHRQRFLKVHRYCAFCGGTVIATTIEHCPPRSLFQFRHWPEGFEFPACEPCNSSSDDDDLLAAMLARMDPFENKGDLDGKQTGLMKAVKRQFPGLVEKMLPTVFEARRNNRELGLTPEAGQTHQETGVVKVPEEFHSSICVLATKLSKGIFYKETGNVFPIDGCLLLNWFTNADLLRSKTYKVFDLLKDLGGTAPPLQRAGTYLNDQFEYKLTFSPEQDIIILQAKFGNAFGFVVFGCTLPGKLEGIVERLREKSLSNGPFAILQSPSIK
jgi:hypothetical protein